MLSVQAGAVADDEDNLAARVDLDQVAGGGGRAPGARQHRSGRGTGYAVGHEPLDLLERHDGLSGEQPVPAVGLAEPVAEVVEPALEGEDRRAAVTGPQ